MKKLFLIIVINLLGFTAVFTQNSVNTVETPTQESRHYEAVPLIYNADTLFYIHTNLVSLTPEERVHNIGIRLKKIFNEGLFLTHEINTFQNGIYMDIACDDVIIMSLSQEDAESQAMPVEELAEIYVERIEKSLQKAHLERNLLTTLMRIGLVLLVAIGFWVIIMLIQKAYKYADKQIAKHSSKWLRDFSYKGYVFLTANQELKVINWVLNILKWAFIIVLVYLLLPLMFSIFPFSRGWAAALFRLVWSPFKNMMFSVWRYLPQLFAIIVIFIVFKYLIKIVKYLFKEIESDKLKINGFHPDWAIPTFNIVRLLLYAFMFVLIFPNLPGSESPVFRGVSVFLGLLVSLGSSTAIANMVAGFVITYMRPFKLGDKIKIGDVTGDVMEKNLLVTRLKTVNNEEITIPNSAILSGNTTNYSALAKSKGLILHTDINISYQYSWQIVHEALLEAASRTSKLLENPNPFVLQTALDDFYVKYTLNVYTHETNIFSPIYTEMHQHILDVFQEKGIEILSPHFLLSERDVVQKK